MCLISQENNFLMFATNVRQRNSRLMFFQYFFPLSPSVVPSLEMSTFYLFATSSFCHIFFLYSLLPKNSKCIIHITCLSKFLFLTSLFSSLFHIPLSLSKKFFFIKRKFMMWCGNNFA